MHAAPKVIVSPAHGGTRLRRLGAGLVLLAAAAMPRPAAAQVQFVACDNGLRCVQAPCPSRDVVLVPSGRRYAKIDPDLSSLRPADAARRDLATGLYSGRLVLAGTVEDGPPVRITATKVIRRATAHEAALCRRR
ncbi:hypothetical protein [Bosea sp. BIWAKO-01]|uniref:hypothetical protein n=1 Tax=Bosea sp. BIWAKO-01 TaxID=506668 RepID=UPI0008538F16|nr:hypothetical protein [Bosea sp. BIWAKO-01]GAU80550.1 hypothetical protein BIWAKO_00437 [Bosea sp. BIWAKO-01]